MEINSTTISSQSETERITLINRFIEKSKEAFLLAIEIMNKPTVTYRIETYSFLICNAWELLLKASIISKGSFKDILYKDDESKTISLEKCLKIMMKENNPVRKNLEFIINNIRHTATHNIIPQHESIFIPILQASAINYAKYIDVMFNDKTLSNIKLFYWATVYDNVDYDDVEKQYGQNIRQQLTFDAEKAQEFMKSNNFDDTSPFTPFAYIQVKVSEVRNPNNSNITYTVMKQGYISIKLDDLITETLFESTKFNPVDILNITVPELKKTKASIPIFYFVKQIKNPSVIGESANDYIIEKLQNGLFPKNIIKNYMPPTKFEKDLEYLKTEVKNKSKPKSFRLKLILRALYDKLELFDSNKLREILTIFYTIDSSVVKETLFKRLVMYIDMLDFIKKEE